MAPTSHALPLPRVYHADAGSNNNNNDEDIGNGGDSSVSSMTISTGGLVAIVVIVFIVAVIGACTAALFFVAKKREWTAKEVLRHSVKKVVTAITPRRTEFPDSVKRTTRSFKRNRRNLSDDDVSPTLPENVGKGLTQDKLQSKSRR